MKIVVAVAVAVKDNNNNNSKIKFIVNKNQINFYCSHKGTKTVRNTRWKEQQQQQKEEDSITQWQNATISV